MAHREIRYSPGVTRLPGMLLASAWGAWKSLWVRLTQALLFRGIRGRETRVAVYRIGSIGDFMHALPALAAIRARHPDAAVTLVCNAVEGEPWPTRLGIDAALDLSIESYADAAGLRGAVRGSECLYYLAPHPLGALRAMRDMLFFASCGIWRARGFAALTARGWCARARRPWRTARTQYQRLLGACGLPEPDDWPGLPLRKPDDAPRKPYVVLAPTGKSQVQRWPEDRFADLAERLAARGVTPVWVGGNEDASRFAEPVGQVMFGRLDFAELRAVLKGATAVVANDSGLAHLAGYVGAPLVVVSSARAAAYAWRPPARTSHVTLLRKDMACEACHRRECSDVACINLISADDVFARLALLLP
jgi:ADP-heptose:LPS heptosyltransferase